MEDLNREELPVTEEEAGFQVDDDQKAEWCIRKIQEAKKEMMDWIEFYVAQTDKVKDKCERRIQFFEYKLMQYFGSVPHKQTKTQESYQLPSGKLVLKKPAIAYEHDDEQLLPWLKQNNMEDFIKIKESVDWSGLKKALLTDKEVDPGWTYLVTDDGEIIPGITRFQKPEEFKVEVK